MVGLAARLTIVGLVIGAVIPAMTNQLGPAGLLSLPYSVMGGILVIRRPRTSIGWILVGLGGFFALISIPVTGVPQQFADGSVDWSVALFAIVHSGLPTTSFFLFAVLLIVFPSGRLPVGRWGRLGRVGLGVGLVFAAAAYVMPEISVLYPASLWVPNPIAVLPDLSIWRVITPATVVIPDMILTIAGSVSLVVRVRRASGTERQQLRWIAASFAFLMFAIVSGYVIGTLIPGSENGGAWIPAMAAFPTVPIAIGIAVLRYRLYDIDRIISRTLGWSLVTGALVAVFGGLVVGLQALFSTFTGGNTLAVAGSTLVVAALFQPLRQRIQGTVDRRFNRARFDAQRTAETFAEQLRNEVDLARLRVALLATADDAVRPVSATVWLRAAGTRVGSGASR